MPLHSSCSTLPFVCACSLSLFPSLLLPEVRQQLVLSPLPLSLYYCCHRQSPTPPRLCAVPIQFGVLLARVQHSAVINHYTTSPPRQPTRPLCIAHAAPPPRLFALPPSLLLRPRFPHVCSPSPSLLLRPRSLPLLLASAALRVFRSSFRPLPLRSPLRLLVTFLSLLLSFLFSHFRVSAFSRTTLAPCLRPTVGR